MPTSGQVRESAHGDAPDLLSSPEAGARLIRGGVTRAGAYVVALLLGLVSLPLMARHLGPVDFGRFVTVTSLVAIASGFAESGLGMIGTREYSVRAAGARRDLMRNLLGMRIVFSVLAVAAAVAFSAASYSNLLVFGTLLAGIGALSADIQRILMIPLNASLRLGAVSALELLRQGVFVLAVVALVLAGSGLLPFFAAGIVAGAAALAATLALVRRELGFAPAFELAAWRLLLRDTVVFSLALALGIVGYRIPLMTMSFVSRDAETGYFAPSLRVFEAVSGIAYLLLGSAFPILSRAAQDDRTRLRYALQRIFEVVTIIGVGLALTIAVGAEFTIRVIGGDRYLRGVSALQVTAAAIAILFAGVTWASGLVALRRHAALLAASAASVGAALLLSPFLVDAAGAKGAAFALLGLEAVYVGGCGLLLMAPATGERVSLRILPRVAASAGGAVAISLLLPVPDVGRMLVAAGVYAAGVAALRALPSEVRQAFAIGGRRAEDVR